MLRKGFLLLAVVLIASCGEPVPTEPGIVPSPTPVPSAGPPTPPDPTQELLRGCLGWNCSLEVWGI